MVKVNGTDVAEENNEFTYTVKGDETEVKIEVTPKIVLSYVSDPTLFTVTRGGQPLASGAEVKKGDVIVVKPAAGKNIVVSVNGATPLTADSEGNFSYTVTGDETSLNITVAPK